MANLFLFSFCFCLLYAPKINMVDLSILVPGLLLLLVLKKNLRWPKSFLRMGYLIFGLISYQAIILILNQASDFFPLARLFRALITVFLVGALFGNPSPAFGRRVLTVLFACLLVHALIIVVAAWYYPLNKILASVSGNDRIKEFRSSGLLAGFDIAGLFCILGLTLLVYLNDIVSSPKWRPILAFIFLLGCYYTSRVSMVLGGLLCLVLVLQIVKNKELDLWYRGLIAIAVSLVFGYFLYRVLLIFEVTMSLGLFNVDPIVAADVLSRHAAQDPNQLLWSDSFILPQSIQGLFLGCGVEFPSDVGYIKEIFRYGLVGLFTAIIGHLWFLSQCLKQIKKRKDTIFVRRLLILTLFIMLLLTLKNEYIWVRGIFPLFLILGGSIPMVWGKQYEVNLHEQ